MTVAVDPSPWWQPWVPFVTAIIGGVIAICGQVFVEWFRERHKRSIECQQKKLLRLMLEPANMPKKNKKQVTWRSFRVLSGVIGADETTAKRLLIEIGARRNMGEKDVWAFEKNKPLVDAENDDGDQE